MGGSANDPRPLTLTTSPQLDAAVQAGWERWEAAARLAGAPAVAAWLARRGDAPELRDELVTPVRTLFDATDPIARGEAWVELAEWADEADDVLLADTFWEGALAAGRDAADPDLIVAATTRLAAIAELHGDPLAAAEYWIDFLNWRREPGHASDAEDVETAFDEIVRLATADGARKEAALYEYRQARYTRLLEADDERAVLGDWEDDPAPYQSWA